MIYLHPWVTPHWNMWMHEGDCDPLRTLDQAPGKPCGPVERGARAGAGLLAGLMTPWRNNAGAVCS